MQNEVIIKANKVTKNFKMESKTFEALKGVSMEIYSNKISVIIGSSGAGKSTLLHILGALDKPTSGEVTINGKQIHLMNDKQVSAFRSTEVGFVFQFHHLLPEFSAAENIAIPLMIAGKSKKQSLVRAEELLELVGLSSKGDNKPAELSGGEQQRIAVARALANNPSIIFADEPTGNLDSINSNSINKIFQTLRDELKKTFVIVTHNAELMKQADYLYEIKDGVIKPGN